ncbi:hypothetical protein [Rhodopseudomonas sp. B29]|uniref:hypothetical protein n=1 Tax=Rhodopseudomonas sp. B29 TaxID=95607 RepID=UPI00034A9AD3|nr:hypothetical protein [Rhodopseudomonas sp. B29]
MNTIAQTILEQLGGRRFVAMTGARNFLSHNDGALSFALPSNFATAGINRVKITLTPTDDYTIEFAKVRGVSIKTIASVDGVYADTLRDVFTDRTGLDTSL